MTDHSNTSAPFTETELSRLWATFGGDHRFEPFQNSHAMRLSAFENAAREIAGSAECGDIASSNATAIAAVIRRHLAGGA